MIGGVFFKVPDTWHLVKCPFVIQMKFNPFSSKLAGEDKTPKG